MMFIRAAMAEARSYPFFANPEIVLTPADKPGRQMVFLFPQKIFSGSAGCRPVPGSPQDSVYPFIRLPGSAFESASAPPA